MIKEAETIWKSISKMTNIGLKEEYLHCIDLQLDQWEANMSKIWSGGKTLESFISDDSTWFEHIEMLGLIALATYYEIAIVVFSLISSLVRDAYTTTLIDESGYRSNKILQMKCADGIFSFQWATFLSPRTFIYLRGGNRPHTIYPSVKFCEELWC